MPTPDETNHLKANWCEDPCWDIEHTEGFEDHYDALLAFRKKQEAIWEARIAARLAEKAEKIGCPGNTMLAAYVETLENRLDQLENRAGV